MAKAQVMLTFDDGLATHLHAADLLEKGGLKGVFGIVTSKVDERGFVGKDIITTCGQWGHFICNHSHTHAWSGQGASKPGLSSCTEEELTEDYTKAQKILNDWGFHGDHLMLPFGSTNIIGTDHLKRLRDAGFKWFRMTVGAPMPKEMGEWALTGNKRHWPKNHKEDLIGITVAADIRLPTEVQDKVDEAIKCEALCVVAYHSVCHVVGETQAITWDQFNKDIEHIAKKVNSGELECVLPTTP